MMEQILFACMIAVTVLESAAVDIYDNLRVGTGFKLMNGDEMCAAIESERVPRIKNATGNMMANMRMYKLISGGNKSDIIFRVLSHRDYFGGNGDIEYESDGSAKAAGYVPQLENDRLLAPIDMDGIAREMKDPANLIAYHGDAQMVHPDMDKVIERIGMDHHIRLLAHGKEDTVDSLHRIHGHGKFCVTQTKNI